MNIILDDFENLPKDFKQKATIYTDMLLDFIKTHNITNFKSKSQIYQNINDSIYPIKFFDFNPKNIADIGSGAGFPGIFLALMLPNISVTLYEPLHKKSAFLHLVKAKLDMGNLSVKSMRIEDEKDTIYDLIVSRAVTQTQALIELCKNISDKNTRFLLYKGSSVLEELRDDLKYDIYKKDDRNYLFLKEVF